MREVQHRVKNDVALIRSLLDLQAANSGSPEVNKALSEASSRIVAIERLYRMLYQGGQFLEIELKEFFTDLLQELRAGTTAGNVTITLSDSNVTRTVSQTRAVALGIIVNELVTNAQKFAFPGVASPRIDVLLSQTEETLTVVVRDNGGGVAEGTIQIPAAASP